MVDVDECSNETHKCSHNCTNTVGGYTCNCPIGFRISSDPKRCIGKNYINSLTVLGSLHIAASVTYILILNGLCETYGYKLQLNAYSGNKNINCPRKRKAYKYIPT